MTLTQAMKALLEGKYVQAVRYSQRGNNVTGYMDNEPVIRRLRMHESDGLEGLVGGIWVPWNSTKFEHLAWEYTETEAPLEDVGSWVKVDNFSSAEPAGKNEEGSKLVLYFDSRVGRLNVTSSVKLADRYTYYIKFKRPAVTVSDLRKILTECSHSETSKIYQMISAVCDKADNDLS